jgi:hypothetical protein
MLSIHKSFSKKDMIEICDLLHIEIEDIGDLNKKQLQVEIINYINKNKKGIFLPNPLFITDINDLEKHLKNINQKKIDYCNTRDEVMFKCKKISAYCKNGYAFYPYSYETLQELTDDIDFILPFGDCPSVRKAIALVNQDIKFRYKYEPVVSAKCIHKLKQKKEMKIRKNGYATIKQGCFKIVFD